jgi:hypothetical protein
MGIGERLGTFGFLARYKGPIGHIKKKEQDKRKLGKSLHYYTSCLTLSLLAFVSFHWHISDSCGKPIHFGDTSHCTC